MKKPEAVKCVKCGERAEPFYREEVRVKGRLVFPARYFERNECEGCEAGSFAAEETYNHDRAAKERLKRAGLGAARLAGVEFSQYRTDHPARERVARMVRPVYTRLARTGTLTNLVLCGGAGGGKSMLAACFAKAAVRQGQHVKFCSWPELCLELRAADLRGQKLALLTALGRYDVLVLDDLGADKATEFVVENLYLLTHRWWERDKTGLVVTTNLPIGAVGEVYGDRVASRLAGMSLLVDFEGCPDGRLGELFGREHHNGN